MLKSSEYFYEDEYMYFTFNGVHSSQYNVIIQNDKEQTLFIERDTKIDFVQPKNQTGQYLLGVSHPQRQFPLKLIATNVNNAQKERLLKWLQPGSTGNLSFDYSKDWEYDVVLQQVKNPTQIVVDYNCYDIILDVVFVTLEKSVAKNIVDGFAHIELNSDITEGLSNLSAYNIPAFYFNIEDKDEDSNCKIVNLDVHFLGNDVAEISFNSKFTIPTSSPVQRSLECKLHDIYNSSVSTFLCTTQKYNNINKIIDFQYNAANNLFFINNYIAEEYIKSDSLLQAATSKEQDKNQYSHVSYNNHPLTLYSPGSPYLINHYTKEDIYNIISTHHKWFVCETTPLESNTLIYCVGDTYDSKLDSQMLLQYDTYYKKNYVDNEKIAAAIYNTMVDVNNKEHNIYIGFYHTISFTTNFDVLTPYITYFNFLA